MVHVPVMMLSEFANTGGCLDIELIHHVVCNHEGFGVRLKSYLSIGLNRTVSQNSHAMAKL